MKDRVNYALFVKDYIYKLSQHSTVVALYETRFHSALEGNSIRGNIRDASEKAEIESCLSRYLNRIVHLVKLSILEQPPAAKETTATSTRYHLFSRSSEKTRKGPLSRKKSRSHIKRAKKANKQMPKVHSWNSIIEAANESQPSSRRRDPSPASSEDSPPNVDTIQTPRWLVCLNAAHKDVLSKYKSVDQQLKDSLDTAYTKLTQSLVAVSTLGYSFS